MVKKLILPLVVVAAFVGYIIYGRTAGAPSATVPAVSTTSALPTTPVSNGTSGTTSSAVSPVATADKYKDGTYTGSITDGYYGNVQVQATIAGGAITDVEFLQYPNEGGNTIAISQRSMPLLKSEAIKAQSANVDIVSGATQTSQAFQQSLSAALSQAS